MHHSLEIGPAERMPSRGMQTQSRGGVQSGARELGTSRVRNALLAAFNNFMWNYPYSDSAELALSTQNFVQSVEHGPDRLFTLQGFEKLVGLKGNAVEAVFNDISAKKSRASLNDFKLYLLSLLKAGD